MHPHLLTFLSHLPEGSFVELAWATEQVRNGDVHYPFRQDSDFLYLTGLSVPDLVVTVYIPPHPLTPSPSEKGNRYQAPSPLGDKWRKECFCTTHSEVGATQGWGEVILWRILITEHDILWGSEKLSDEEMRKISGIEDIRDISELESYKNSLQSHYMFDPKALLTQMRLYKTPDEIEKIRQAITITNRAFERAKKEIRAGMYEYEVDTIFASVFREHHLTEAYPTIVGSGPNACILHYTKNTRRIEEWDLILIDAGCEYMGYASDWTRMPSVGSISPRKQAVLDAVARVKTFAESQMKPGVAKLDYEKSVREFMIQELENLWPIEASLSDEEKLTHSKIFYPHSTSHFLGLDVHDVGARDAVFATGMVLTIEPGIYIREEGIGVRLEDDYLITETGCEKL